MGPELAARLQREQRHALAVNGDLKLVRVREADAAVAFPLNAAEQVDCDFVGAVARKVVLHEQAAARSERQPVDMVVLRLGFRDAVLPDGGRGERAAERFAAYLACGG